MRVLTINKLICKSFLPIEKKLRVIIKFFLIGRKYSRKKTLKIIKKIIFCKIIDETFVIVYVIN